MKDWEEKFDFEFFNEEAGLWKKFDPDEVKDFIRSLLASEKKALLNKIKDELVYNSKNLYTKDAKPVTLYVETSLVLKIIDKLKEMEKE